MKIEIDEKEKKYLTELLDSQIGEEGEFHENPQDIMNLKFDGKTIMIMNLIHKIANAK